MRLIYVLAFSGLFGKSKQELELLPPPPPFPKIEEEQIKQEVSIKEKNGKKKQQELESRKIEENRRKELERKKEVSEKQKEEIKKVKIEEKLIKETEKSKPVFEKFFSKKEERIEPVEIKSDIPKITAEKDIGKPHEILEAEKEIQRAIEGIKKIDESKPILKKLFGDKKKIEKPDLIPQFEEKVDSVDSIEAKMHRTRLALMDFKFDEAKRIYVEIMKIYNDLEPKKKARVYLDIRDLYYERKTAEKYAK